MKNYILIAATLLAMLMPTTTMAQESTTGNLFTGQSKKLQFGLSVGWVAKEWTTSASGRTLHEDLWGNPDKLLHGVQFGLQVNKCLFYGLGCRSGLYYEWYISHDKFLKENGWNRFNEHSLYIPLHIQFSLPITKKISITPYGGLGMNIALKGNTKNGPLTNAKGQETGGVSNAGNVIEDIYLTAVDNSNLGDLVFVIIDNATNNRREYMQHDMQTYEYNNHSPRKFNWQAEAGIAVRFSSVQLTFTYSWGLSHHYLYSDVPSKQNKFAANLAYIF